MKAAGTPAQIARGGQLAWGCADCHSPTLDLPLGGSIENFFAGGPPMGGLYAPNLTPGGRLPGWTDSELVRAIREGIGKDGRPLIVHAGAGLPPSERRRCGGAGGLPALAAGRG